MKYLMWFFTILHELFNFLEKLGENKYIILVRLYIEITQEPKQELRYPSFSIIIEWGRIFQSDEKWCARTMLQRLCEQIIEIIKKF